MTGALIVWAFSVHTRHRYDGDSLKAVVIRDLRLKDEKKEVRVRFKKGKEN